jgi:hypothetical protein
MRIRHALVCALTLMLAAFAVSAAAQSDEHSTPRVPGDGIKVHGHWTIELTNKDGTIAAHHEFENALLNQGARVLATLLHGNTPRGLWLLQIGNPNGSGPCGPNSTPCFLAEPGYAIPTPPLTVELMANGESVRLSGTTTADHDADVSLVTSTQVIGNASFVFSQRTLAAPIHVVSGQSITVSVVFSFS